MGGLLRQRLRNSLYSQSSDDFTWMFPPIRALSRRLVGPLRVVLRWNPARTFWSFTRPRERDCAGPERLKHTPATAADRDELGPGIGIGEPIPLHEVY